MKQILLIILSALAIYSCKNISNSKENPKTDNLKLENKEVSKQNLEEVKIATEIDIDSKLQIEITKALNTFPKDSASLHRFYYEWFPAKEQDRKNRHIACLKKLTSIETVERYKSVEMNLKPLLTRIVKTNMMSKEQSDSLVTLYSDFDELSGESLFSRLFTDDENYNLVWRSFDIMAKESEKDTCYISSLIKLDDNIKTNAELAEEMGEFIVKSIRNNPTGFLDMYSQRNNVYRTEFGNYIAVWEDPDKELIDKFTDLSVNSTNEVYKNLATELINTFKIR